MNAKKQLTILHTIETGGPGGAETLVLQLASRLDPERFRSLVLFPGGTWLPQQLADRDIPAVISDSRGWYDPRLLVSLVQTIRRERVDLIHSHLPGQNFYACLAGKLTRKPAIVTYHGAVELEQSRGVKGTVRLQTVRRAATAFLVVCDQMADALRAADFAPEKIVRIYNGVDVNRYHPEGTGKLRALLGVGADTPIVGMVANIRTPKGYDYFIRAARLVADRAPNARFVSIGEPLAGLSERLAALVSELKLEKQFTFLGFRQDVPDLLSDFNVFVLSSLSEGFPFVALESMAAGKPSVMTRCGGPEEIAEDGVTGFLVPTADAPALAEKITYLLSHPERAAAMGRAAKEKVLRQYSLDAMIAGYENLYQQLCMRGSQALRDEWALNSGQKVAPRA